MSVPARILVKICGLTSPTMIADAASAGADAIGLVLAPSPRRVTPERAGELLATVPPGIERVAVFAEPGEGELEAIRDLPFDGLQASAGWQGASALPNGWFFLPVLHDGEDLEERARAIAGEQEVPARPSLRGMFLVDGPRGGGKGIPVDLDRAARAARYGRASLAGGLRPETVAEAIRRVRPAAVDVSSGVESAPGVKDPVLVARFVAAAREAERRALQETEERE